ncbi:hypothetical protein [Aliikangiella coralliicola]|uniref:Uncharacterized protein n=1 Tax=Aliikangiella coralliicola TaxID=2592383 RepID=A0A545U4G6_9GAMM|nr:hypothetical protein [Aliikangiella coralliicola]TQV84352.1 hypothetical protein FLL46_22265 [Aliikangiella coralliicola]
MDKNSTLATLLLIILFVSLPVISVVPEQSMTFKEMSSGGNCSHCSWIVAQGTITNQTVAEFESLIANGDMRTGGIVILNSLGGELGAGLRLGHLLRKMEANVHVGSEFSGEGEGTGGVCYSACAYAFLGGMTRSVSHQSSYGVHQFFIAKESKKIAGSFSSIGDISSTQLVAAVILDYVISMGIDPKLVAIASKIPPNIPIRELNEKELHELQIDNSTPLASPWRLEPVENGIVAENQQKQSFFGKKHQVITAQVFCKKGDPLPVYFLRIKEKLSPTLLKLDWIKNHSIRQQTFIDVKIHIDETFNINSEDFPVVSNLIENSKTLTFEILLNRKLVERLINNTAQFFYVSSNSAHFTWPVLRAYFPLEERATGTANKIKFAVNQCHN